jgi:hypothetical protein
VHTTSPQPIPLMHTHICLWSFACKLACDFSISSAFILIIVPTYPNYFLRLQRMEIRKSISLLQSANSVSYGTFSKSRTVIMNATVINRGSKAATVTRWSSRMSQSLTAGSCMRSSRLATLPRLLSWLLHQWKSAPSVWRIDAKSGGFGFSFHVFG